MRSARRDGLIWWDVLRLRRTLPLAFWFDSTSEGLNNYPNSLLHFSRWTGRPPNSHGYIDRHSETTDISFKISLSTELQIGYRILITSIHKLVICLHA
jgi:hypothetical protein